MEKGHSVLSTPLPLLAMLVVCSVLRTARQLKCSGAPTSNLEGPEALKRLAHVSTGAVELARVFSLSALRRNIVAP